MVRVGHCPASCPHSALCMYTVGEQWGSGLAPWPVPTCHGGWGATVILGTLVSVDVSGDDNEPSPVPASQGWGKIDARGRRGREEGAPHHPSHCCRRNPGEPLCLFVLWLHFFFREKDTMMKPIPRSAWGPALCKVTGAELEPRVGM